MLLSCAFNFKMALCFLEAFHLHDSLILSIAYQTNIATPVSLSMPENSKSASVQLWPWQKRALEIGRMPLPESPGERPWLNLSQDTEISATPLSALTNVSTPQRRNCHQTVASITKSLSKLNIS